MLRSIFNCPTAPFHEYHVRDHLLKLLADFPHVSVEQDGFGNLIARYQRGSGKARWAFGAHMDHPGWVKNPVGVDSPKGGMDARFPEMRFLGGVPESYLSTGEVVDFGEFAMWDLPAFEYDREEDRISGRVCDDLVGCAAIIAMFYELEQRQANGSCYGIFTRAEEVGFVGAVDLAKNGKFPKAAYFVSLETSSPRAGVEMGKGPVIRVGDRLSSFDDEATAKMLRMAAAGKLEVQRALLDGGACEATAMQSYGIPSAGISILLGNYHNCASSGQIDSEYVRLKDVKAMIELISNLVQFAEGQSGKTCREMERLELEQRWRDYAPYVQATAGKFDGVGKK